MDGLITLVSGVILLVLLPAWFFKRRGVEVQGVLVLLRTKRGLRFLDGLAVRRRAWMFFSDLGIMVSLGLVGAVVLGRRTGKWARVLAEYALSTCISSVLILPFAGNLPLSLAVMSFGVSFFILAALAQNTLLIVQGYFSGARPAPGVVPIIPGTGNVPLYAVLSLAVLLAVHETAHGVVARAERIRVKSLGLLLLGIVPVGAFTEPDEDQLNRTRREKRMRVYAAGSMANFVTAAVFFLVLAASASVVQGYLIYGVPAFDGQKGAMLPMVISADPAKQDYLIQFVEQGSPAEKAGLRPGMIVENAETLFNKRPGETITLVANGTKFTVTADAKGMIGVTGSIIPEYDKYSPGDWAGVLFLGFLAWTFLLNYLVGMVNLLPFVMLDGYKLAEDAVSEFVKNKKTRKLVTRALAAIVGLLLILNAVPWFF